MIECEHDRRPLDAVTAGCELPFTQNGQEAQRAACLGVVATLGELGFTGVCECYLKVGYKPGLFNLGVAAGPTDDPGSEWWGEAMGRPPKGWWADFVDLIASFCGEEAEAKLNRGWCGSCSAAGLRAGMRHVGTAGFEAGLAVWGSAPSGSGGSIFLAACRSHGENRRTSRGT